MNLKALSLYDEFFICAYCAYCIDNEAACPTFRSIKHEIATGRGKMLTARYLSKGLLSESQGLAALSEGLFQCTFCGACSEVCLVDIPLTDVYSELKELVQKYLPEGTKRSFEHLIRSNNIYNLDQEDRNFWSVDVEEIYEKWVNKRAEIGYFIGCVASYSSRAASAPVSILKLSQIASNPISIFSPEEYCCGNPFLLGGNPKEARHIARHNIFQISQLGIQTLMVSCAGCYRVFTKEYPKLLNHNLPFKVITHMEYITNLIRTKKLNPRNNKPIKVTFKDPCELGRHCGVYEIARELIALLPGVEYQEMENNRSRALCCGAGGLLLANYPKMAEDIAKRLIKQMEDINISLCLNACPSCQINIDNTLRKMKSPIKSIDITDLVRDRMIER
ncbi:(Fe-S)-binding protein [Candidatus Hodarchaeum mangrovi]